MTDENGDVHRIAFRGSDEMMNDAQLIRGESLPLANVYRAFVGPLSITVHEAVVHVPGATSAPGAIPTPAGEQEASSLASDLRTIAIVNAHARPIYRANVEGVETIDGRETYLIGLDPTSDPDRHALRDLWIDSTTHDVWRADYVTHDSNIPTATVYLTVNFVPVGSYLIAGSWVAIYHFGGSDPPFYRELHVEKMSFPDSLPDWLFDQRAYDRHRSENAADPLEHIFEASPAP